MRPGAELLATRGTGLPQRDDPALTVWSGGAEDSAVAMGEGLLLSAYRKPSSGEAVMLFWDPELAYHMITGSQKFSTEALFVHNYSREALLPQPECFTSAIEAASRGESLAVSNRLVVLAADGTVVANTVLGDRYNPTAATAGVMGGWDIGIVSFNSGYQVNESLYRELTLPKLELGEGLSSRAAEEIYGSFRGLMAIDLGDGSVLWERRLGAIPGRAAIADLNGDGVNEIVVPTGSPHNGVSGGGTTDYMCNYILCLDTTGSELWRSRRVGPFLNAQLSVADVVGDSCLEVICYHSSSQMQDWGCLAVLSCNGDVLSMREDLGGLRGLVLADVDQDNRDEIIVGGTAGQLLVLDGELSLVTAYKDTSHRAYKARSVTPLAANDLDGDGCTEIAAVTSGWTVVEWDPKIARGTVLMDSLWHVLVLGADMSVEARATLALGEAGATGLGRGPGRPNGLVADLDGDARNEIVLGRGRHGAWVFEIVGEGGG
jgi:hypothetical protein